MLTFLAVDALAFGLAAEVLVAAGLAFGAFAVDDEAFTGLFSFSFVDALLGSPSLTFPEMPLQWSQIHGPTSRNRGECQKKETPSTWCAARDAPFGSENVPFSAPDLMLRLSWFVICRLNSIP